MDLVNADRAARQNRRQRAGVVPNVGRAGSRHRDVDHHTIGLGSDRPGDPGRRVCGGGSQAGQRRHAHAAQRLRQGTEGGEFGVDERPGVDVEARQAVARERTHGRLVVGVAGQRAVRLGVDRGLHSVDRAEEQVLVREGVRAGVNTGAGRVDRGSGIVLAGDNQAGTADLRSNPGLSGRAVLESDDDHCARRVEVHAGQGSGRRGRRTNSAEARNGNRDLAFHPRLERRRVGEVRRNGARQLVQGLVQGVVELGSILESGEMAHEVCELGVLITGKVRPDFQERDRVLRSDARGQRLGAGGAGQHEGAGRRHDHEAQDYRQGNAPSQTARTRRHWNKHDVGRPLIAHGDNCGLLIWRLSIRLRCVQGLAIRRLAERLAGWRLARGRRCVGRRGHRPG